MTEIRHLITIQAPRERVYEALATAEGIRNWWTRDAAVDSKLGGAGRIGFNDGASITMLRVDELEPPVRVRWTITASFLPQWEGTAVTFDLRADGGDTVLAFAHRGFARADDVYAFTTTGWGYYLVSLQQYLETGSGAPHPNVDFGRVVRGEACAACELLLQA